MMRHILYTYLCSLTWRNLGIILRPTATLDPLLQHLFPQLQQLEAINTLSGGT